MPHKNNFSSFEVRFFFLFLVHHITVVSAMLLSFCVQFCLDLSSLPLLAISLFQFGYHLLRRLRFTNACTEMCHQCPLTFPFSLELEKYMM